MKSNHTLKSNLKSKSSFTLALVLMTCLPFLLGVAGCQNAFSELANKKSDAALLYQAQMLSDQQDYVGAIEVLNSMSADGLVRRETKVVLASAYAGVCGLNLLNLAKSVSDGTASSQKLWPILLSAFKSFSLGQFAFCQQAETTLKSISETAGDRTANENVLMAFIQFTKMGTALASSNLDADDDGSIDASADACSASDIPDSTVQELGSGLSNAILSLAASGSSVAGGVASAVTTICSTIDAALSTTGFCQQTSATDFTGDEIKTLRGLIKSNELGFSIQNCSGTYASSPECVCL